MASRKVENPQNPRSAATRKRTRIQAEKQELILEAALDVFSRNGFRGSTIDQIAERAGLSKPNLLYYFRTKEAIHRQLIDRLLENWLGPLQQIDPDGEPIEEIRSYIRRKLQLARDYPRESRLFANEILQGAPRIGEELADLKQLVDEKSEIFETWIARGELAPSDPRHLLFSIWAVTQHYADFDAQVQAVLGAGVEDEARFEEAARYLDQLFVNGLKPKGLKETGLKPKG